MQPPPDPPLNEGPLAIASHYIESHEKEYVRIRNLSKKRVSGVITLVAALNATIAVLGVASATWKYPWFGLGSTVLAGVVGILAARNNLFRDQELWQLRSITLSRIQHLKRDMQYRVASGEDEQLIAADIKNRLDEILDQDLRGWSGVSGSTFTLPEVTGPASSGAATEGPSST
ncbi:SLATT domain-containing protein [Streptomyces sp. NPDC002491]